MPLLPPSTHAHYRGAPVAAHFLTLLGVLTLVPGLLHTFLPDGGAGGIAGLDLAREGALIVGVFAWMGATQIAWGTLMLLVSRRYRRLGAVDTLLRDEERAWSIPNQRLLDEIVLR